MLIPYAVDVPLDRRPFMNWLLVTSIVAAFAFQITSAPESWEVYIMNGWNPKGLFGHMWLHGDIFHLLGNLIFLWVFGNAVCSKTGNLLFVPLYLLFGLSAAAAHLLFDGNPALGASGAINGVVGMFLVFFPRNDISCLWLFWYRFVRTFDVSSFWIILYFLAYDIFGLLIWGGNVAYFAHFGGFAVGFVTAFLLLGLGIVQMTEDEQSILCLIKKWWVARQDEKLYWEAVAAVEKAKKEQVDYNVQSAQLNTNAHSAVSKKTLLFFCACGQRIQVPLQYAGHTGVCPVCKQRINIPCPT